MNNAETLEELREMRNYAKQDAKESQDALNAMTYDLNSFTNLHHIKLEVLRKAEERYVAHLEMMAAGVRQ